MTVGTWASERASGLIRTGHHQRDCTKKRNRRRCESKLAIYVQRGSDTVGYEGCETVNLEDAIRSEISDELKPEVQTMTSAINNRFR